MTITFSSGIRNHKPTSRIVPCTCKNALVACSYCNFKREYAEMDIPEINLANTNAVAMIRLLGLPVDYCGEVPFNKIPDIRRNILKLINVKSLRMSAIRSTVKEANFYAMGVDDAYVLEKLKMIDTIMVYCQKHNEDFVWC